MREKKKLQRIDVDKVVKAIIADDPDAAMFRDDLRLAIQDLKDGRFAAKAKVHVPPVVTQLRHKTGLSQKNFAEQLGISVNTLKSWEQGVRNPSGAALKLIQLLNKHPELIKEL